MHYKVTMFVFYGMTTAILLVITDSCINTKIYYYYNDTPPQSFNFKQMILRLLFLFFKIGNNEMYIFSKT